MMILARCVLLIWLWSLVCPFARAGQVRALSGENFNGEITFSGTNRFTIQFSGSARREFFLNQIASVIVNDAKVNFSDYAVMPAGWKTQSIGDVNMAGSAGVSNHTFAIRAAALDVGDIGDTFSFVSCNLRGNGELVARVFSIDGADRLAKAGIMIRERADAVSKFVMVSVNADGGVAFQYRAESRQKSVDSPILAMQIPCWLKLGRQGEVFTGFYSRDGREWKEAGRASVNIAENASVGFALTSHSTFAMASAQVDEVRLTQNGLLGEYYNDEEFKNRKLMRIDPVINFGWGLDAPAKEMHADHFTVRWTGQIESKVTGLHVFVCDADDSADLWLDEQPIPRTPFKKESSKNPPSVALVAGKRYDVRFEYREVTGPASVRLGWAPPGQNRELIPTTAFFCTTEVGATNTGSITEGTISAPVAGQAKGIYLRSGSFITGSVKTVNEANVQFAYRSDKEYSVLPREVSRIVLRSPPRAGGPDPAAGRTGILLQSGEFFEGEITGIANGQVLLSSVLFGLRKYAVPDVCVIYTSVGAGSPARFSVHLRDGTVFRVDTLYPEGDELILFEPILGQFRVALSAITEIRNSSERAGQDLR